jgi:hypothetical protein
MPKRAGDIHTYGHTYIHAYIILVQVPWYVHTSRGRGRKSYFVQNMRQDVAMLCLRSNTIATKRVSGAEKDNHIPFWYIYKDRGNAPCDFDTGIITSSAPQDLCKGGLSYQSAMVVTSTLGRVVVMTSVSRTQWMQTR